MKNRKSFPSISDDVPDKYLYYLIRLDILLLYLHQYYEEWMSEELSQRLISHIKEFQKHEQNLENFKRLLINNLHNRDISKTTLSDAAAMKTLQERCRVIELNESILCEITATLLSSDISNNTSTLENKSSILNIQSYATSLLSKSGTLYITKYHIFFYSVSYFSSPVMKLIRIPDIYSCFSSKLSNNGNTSSGITMDPTVLTIQDIGKQLCYFQIIGPTPDYCSRVSDLISFLIQVRY
jgi:hypothetical protein